MHCLALLQPALMLALVSLPFAASGQTGPLPSGPLPSGPPQTRPPQTGQTSTTLPSVDTLRARALAGFAQAARQRERFLCRERIDDTELDGHSRPRKTTTLEREVFFVNGYAIAQPVTRDGKPLSASEQKQRDQRVADAIHSAENHRQPKPSGLEINPADVLRLATLDQERRIQVGGRPTIVFNVVSNPGAVADTVVKKIVRAMQGTVAIDEQTGNLQDLNVEGVTDVKVAGGLVASIHKGFRLHVVVGPVAEGVWLLELAEGTGSARMGLFLERGMTFRQRTQGCRLFDVTAETLPPANTVRQPSHP